MAVPMVLAGLSLGSSALGTGLSLYSNFQNNLAQKRMISERNRIAKTNYGYQKEAAKTNFETGSDQIDLFKEQGEAALGTSESFAATSGVGKGGSQELVSEVSKNNLRTDIETLKSNNLTQYQRSIDQAKLDYEAGYSSYSGGAGFGLTQASTLLTGLSGMYGQALDTGMISPYQSKKNSASKGTMLSHQSYYGW